MGQNRGWGQWPELALPSLPLPSPFTAQVTLGLLSLLLLPWKDLKKGSHSFTGHLQNHRQLGIFILHVGHH